MSFPNCDIAYIPPQKLTGYLLSETHAVGKAKAQFFRAHGYDNDNAALLEKALLLIAENGQVAMKTTSPFGTKYVVDGTIETPQGTHVTLRTVWIVEPGDERPRFVTAHPN